MAKDKITKNTQLSQQDVGKEQNKKLSIAEKIKSLGSTGTDIYAGIISEEYNPELTGIRGAEVYDEMRRSDATVSALLIACSLPIRSTDWDVLPAENEDGKAEDFDWEVANFVKEALFERMENTWDQFLQECLTFFQFGYSIFEKVYTIDSEHVWIKKIAYRSPKTIWKWESTEGVPGIEQQLSTGIQRGENKGKSNVFIPATKLLRFTINQEGDNYEGISILRPAYKHWYFKQSLEKYDAIRHQKQGVGVPVLTLPDGASDEDIQAAEEIVDNFKSNERSGIVLPGEKWKFEFADLRAGDSTQILESIKYQKNQIVMAALAQFLDLGSGATGSFALSKDQSDLFLQAMESYAKLIADTVNRFLVKELVDLNFDVERYPKLTFTGIRGDTNDKIIDMIDKALKSGAITSDDDIEGHVRNILGLPAKSTDDDVDDGADSDEATPPEEIEDEIADMPDGDFSDTCKDHKHKKKYGDLGNCHDDDFYTSFSHFLNNKYIVDLQNNMSAAEKSAAKKKGLKFNEYESKARRPMTFAERKVNLSQISAAMAKYENQLQGEAKKVFNTMKKDLLQQVEDAIRLNNVEGINNIAVRNIDELSNALTVTQKSMFDIGKQGAAAEMKVAVPPTSANISGALRVQNDQLAQKIANDMTNVAKSAAVATIAKTGGDVQDVALTRTKKAVKAAIDGQIPKAMAGLKTLGVTASINMGRTAVFEQHPEMVYGMQYSAILDGRTSDRCMSLDGRVVKAGSSAFYDYSPPQHYNCRSIWVEILVDEVFKPKITGIPSSIAPALSLDNVPNISKPIIAKNSPAISQLQDEIKKRKEKIKQLQETGKFPNRLAQHQKRVKQLESTIKGKFGEIVQTIIK